MTAPNAPMSAELVAYRLHTGSDRSKWQWMDGTPSVGAMREAELHGWEIEYAYGSAAVAAMAEREAAMTAELVRARDSVQFVGKFLEAMGNEMRAAGCAVEGCKVRNVRAETAEAERDALVKEVEALREDAERLSFLLTAEAAVHRMGDTGLYMIVSIEGDPYDGSEHETASAAIDAARAEASKP